MIAQFYKIYSPQKKGQNYELKNTTATKTKLE